MLIRRGEDVYLNGVDFLFDPEGISGLLLVDFQKRLTCGKPSGFSNFSYLYARGVFAWNCS